MHRRQPLPRLWLMTDERQGEALWTALDRLPRGAGVVFRHYRTAPEQRRDLFKLVGKIARRKRLLLLLAGPPAAARAWGAKGCHGRGRKASGLIMTAPAHSLLEIRRAEARGADLVFLSPVFATRSHADAKPLGRVGFGIIARSTRLPVIALGGMNPKRGRRLAGLGSYGWAAIDSWSV